MSRRQIVVVATFPFVKRLPLGDWQLARALVRLGHDVLYVDPSVSPAAPWRHGLPPQVARGRVYEQQDGVLVGTPIALRGTQPWLLPPLQDKLSGLQLGRWIRRLGWTDPVLLTTAPNRGTWPGVPRSALVYWQKDRQFASETAPRPEWTLARHRTLLREADLVTGVSPTIVQDGAALGIRTVLIPNGFDPTLYASPPPPPPEVAALPRPRLVFVGSWGWRVDRDLIAGLAAARPDWSILVIGRAQEADRVPGVHFLGPRDVADVPAVLAACDVGLVPYLDHEFNRASSPLKVYEYLGAGLPVVMSGFDIDIDPRFVTSASGVQEWVRAVEAFLAQGASGSPELRAAAQEHTWERRAEHLLEALPP